MNETNGVPYCAQAIADGFWSIDEGGVRCFLIEGLEKAMLVDTGFGTGDMKAFAGSLTKLPIFLINTHTDGDHTGCNGSFEKVIMHPAEAGYYQMKKPGNHSIIDFVEDGDIIDLGNRQFEIIHIPGHTPGSIALLDREDKLLLSGDSVQLGHIYMFGEGRDLEAYIRSMQKLEGRIAGVERIFPSHGEMPVQADIIPELIEGAQRVLNGEIEGENPPRPMPCKLYTVGRVKFLYNIQPVR
jgi:glyoxylase-like metal-dependent hydrolase (beta-lactamase superfamily II)